jgi:DNA-binding transcriptional MerR regulator
VGSPIEFLNPAQAARRLGVSAKALRVYERRGLLQPLRTSAGWRAYGPEQMARASGIAALRALGLSLAEVARVLAGDAQALAPALAAHQARLEGQLCDLATVIERVAALRARLAGGETPSLAELAQALNTPPDVRLAFDLPWPWGGERFELRRIRPLTYITGPLGSGKTRLAQRLAEAVGARFLGLARLDDGEAETRNRTDEDPAAAARAKRALAWLADEGASMSPALAALVGALAAHQAPALVLDMVEQGLDEPTQRAVAAWLRGQASATRPVFLLTRSSAILDLAAVGPDEAILFCPANHSPPMEVVPIPGAPGYEALASCLAAPDVRARTAGMVAWQPAPPGAAVSV